MMNWFLVLFAYLGLFSLSLLDNGRGSAYPEILNYFDIGPGKGAYIFSIASFTSILVNSTGRFWLKKLGVINSHRLALFFLSLGGGTLFLSAQFQSYTTLLLSSFILGVGLSAMGITMNLLIVLGSSFEMKRRVMGGLHSVYGAVSFIVPLIYTLFLHYDLQWFHFFLFLGLFPLFVIALSFSKRFELKEQVIERNPSYEKSQLTYLKRLPYGLMFGLYVAAEIAMSSRLVIFLRESKGFSQQDSSLYLSIFFVGLFLGRIILASKNFKEDGRTLLLYSLGLSLIFFILGEFYMPIFYPLIGLSFSIFFPVAMDWISGEFKDDVEFMISSVMTFIGVSLGLMHYLFGFVSERFGNEVSFRIIPLCALGAFLILITIKERKGNE